MQKVLGSVHKGGNVAVLDGEKSFMQNKRTGQKTTISYEGGQCVMYLWVTAGPTEAEKEITSPLKGNLFAILATDGEQVFSRQVKSG